MAKFQTPVSPSGPPSSSVQHSVASSLSRASSTGSLHTLGGSAANTDYGPTDDEDSDGRSGYSLSHANLSGAMTYRERRREAHTQAEQKRRDSIKKGYDYLQELVPTVIGGCGPGSPGADGSGPSPGSPDDLLATNGKFSKATILQKSIDYILYMQQQRKRQDEDLAQLKKEIVALQIMRANYEQLVNAHRANNRALSGGGGVGEQQRGSADEDPLVSSPELKFEVFRTMMDKLFASFNERVSMNHFSELSAGVISWLEEQCKPPLLQEMMYDILQDVRTKLLIERATRESTTAGSVGSSETIAAGTSSIASSNSTSSSI